MEIIPLNHKRTFSYEQAQEILPVVYRITEAAQKEVRTLVNRIDSLKGTQNSRVTELEAQVNQIIDGWQQKLVKLGASPKGLWLADFDNGNGYYCWKFPETVISYWHGYNDGFSGRVLIQPGSNEKQ